MTITSVRVYGQVDLPNTAPAEGAVAKFTPNAQAVNAADRIVLRKEIPVAVAADGSLPDDFVLYATDDPGVQPDGLGYVMVIEYPGAKLEPLVFNLPHTADSFDISNATPPSPTSPTFAYANQAAIDAALAEMEAENQAAIDAATAANQAAIDELSTTVNGEISSLDSAAVHKAGTETVTGDKDFTGALTHGGADVVDTAGTGLTKSGTTISRAPSATGYADLAALPAASSGNAGQLERTADGGIYESDGSAWQVVRDPDGTYPTLGISPPDGLTNNLDHYVVETGAVSYSSAGIPGLTRGPFRNIPLVDPVTGEQTYDPFTLFSYVRDADGARYLAVPGLIVLPGGAGVTSFEDMLVVGDSDEIQTQIYGWDVQTLPVVAFGNASRAYRFTMENDGTLRQKPSLRTPTGSRPQSYGNTIAAFATPFGVGTEVVQQGASMGVVGSLYVRSSSPSVLKAKINPTISPAPLSLARKLASSISAGAGVIPLDGSATGFPTPPFLLLLRKNYQSATFEVIRVNAVSGNNLGTLAQPCDRGVDGTTAQAWTGPRTVNDGVVQAGNKVVTSATANWTSDDVGQQITIPGAGVSAGLHKTSIFSVDSPTQIHLLTAPATTINPDANGNAQATATINMFTTSVVEWVILTNTDTSTAYASPNSVYLSGATGTYGTPPFNMRLLDPDNPTNFEVITVSSVQSARQVANAGSMSLTVDADHPTRHTLYCPGANFTGADIGATVRVPEAGPVGAFGATDLITTIASVTDSTHAELTAATNATVNFETITIGSNNLATITARGVSGTQRAWLDGTQVQPDPQPGLQISGSSTQGVIDSFGNHPISIRQNGIENASIAVGGVWRITSLQAGELGIGTAPTSGRAVQISATPTATAGASVYGVRSEVVRTLAANSGQGVRNFYSKPSLNNTTAAALTIDTVNHFEVSAPTLSNTGGGGNPTINQHYGLVVPALTSVSAAAGVAIAGQSSPSVALWLSYLSTPSSQFGGIWFGSDKVNLYRAGTGLLKTDTDLQVGGKFGTNGSAAAAKQTVSGSRGGNAALASLLTALATFGLITDSTTA